MRWVAVWVVLGGCASRPLDEVPIHGGTLAQQQVVRETIAEFEAWIGPGRVELSAVVFTPGVRDAVGRYWVAQRRIRILDSVEGAELERVVRHELCHAVDLQGDLLSRPDPTFDTLVERVRAQEAHPLHPVVGESRRADRGELFANLCEYGPARTHLVATPCPGDPEYLAAAARWLEDEVWTGEPGLSFGPGPAVTEQAGFETGWSVDQLELVGGRDEAAVLVTAYSPIDTTPAGRSPWSRDWRDLATGEVVPYEVSGHWLPGEGFLEPIPASWPAGLPDPRPFDDEAADPVDSVVDGDRALVVSRRVPLGDWSTGRPLAPRVWSWDGADWSVVEACPSRLASVFATPEGLYLGDGESETGRVTWSAVDW